MSATCFHDGRIRIVTIGAAATPQDQAAMSEALGEGPDREAPAVLLDARRHTTGDLAERVDRLLASAPRVARLALLLSAEAHLAQAHVLRLLLQERGRAAQVFENLGLALRWVWCLDDATLPAFEVPRERTAAGVSSARIRRRGVGTEPGTSS